MAEQDLKIFFFFFTVVLLTVEKQSEHVWSKRPESDPRGLRLWGERDVEVADIFKKKNSSRSDWVERDLRKKSGLKEKKDREKHKIKGVSIICRPNDQQLRISIMI